MTNPKATRSPKQIAVMRKTTGPGLPFQQPKRPDDQTFDPRTFAHPPAPTYDYEFRRWVWPELDPVRWGTPRDRFKAWEDEA